MQSALQVSETVRVRFGEVDSMQIVWHGNYVKYFEEGREAFAQRYEMGYDFLRKNGLMAPIVELQVQYKQPLRYGDQALVETSLTVSESSKIIFDYRIYRKSDRQLACTGRTVQVLVDQQMQLQLTVPPCVEQWQQQWMSLTPVSL